jgi:hypothetical protein
MNISEPIILIARISLLLSLEFLKSILCNSLFNCFIPIIPPLIVPDISNFDFWFIFITDVLINIIPPFILNSFIKALKES